MSELSNNQQSEEVTKLLETLNQQIVSLRELNLNAVETLEKLLQSAPSDEAVASIRETIQAIKDTLGTLE